MKRLLLPCLLVLFCGCAGIRDRSRIKDNFLVTGMDSNDFVSAWGRPTRTYTLSGDSQEFEIIWSGEANATGGQGGATASGENVSVNVPNGTKFDGKLSRAVTRPSAIKSNRTYNVWDYKERGVIAVFDRRNLVTWKWKDGAGSIGR